jgi:hypothetical protein
MAFTPEDTRGAKPALWDASSVLAKRFGLSPDDVLADKKGLRQVAKQNAVRRMGRLPGAYHTKDPLYGKPIYTPEDYKLVPTPQEISKRGPMPRAYYRAADDVAKKYKLQWPDVLNDREGLHQIALSKMEKKIGPPPERPVTPLDSRDGRMLQRRYNLRSLPNWAWRQFDKTGEVMDSRSLEIIHKIAAEGTSVKKASAHDRQYIEGHRVTASPDIGARLVDDFIKGAMRNPRLGHVQYDGVQSVKMASEEMTPIEIAKLAGTLQALAEAEFTLKDASEALNLPVETIQAVLDAVK